MPEAELTKLLRIAADMANTAAAHRDGGGSMFLRALALFTSVLAEFPIEDEPHLAVNIERRLLTITFKSERDPVVLRFDMDTGDIMVVPTEPMTATRM